MSLPTFVGRHIVFVLSVTRFVSATPLKLLNRISWNLVGSKDTICSSAYYQEIWIPLILWGVMPPLKSLEHRLSNFLEWGTLPWQYGITYNPCFSTFDHFFVHHVLRTVFFYSLKLNFICYLNRLFTFDYSLWDGGRHTFLPAKIEFNW